MLDRLAPLSASDVEVIPPAAVARQRAANASSRPAGLPEWRGAPDAVGAGDVYVEIEAATADGVGAQVVFDTRGDIKAWRPVPPARGVAAQISEKERELADLRAKNAPLRAAVRATLQEERERGLMLAAGRKESAKLAGELREIDEARAEEVESAKKLARQAVAAKRRSRRRESGKIASSRRGDGPKPSASPPSTAVGDSKSPSDIAAFAEDEHTGQAEEASPRTDAGNVDSDPDEDAGTIFGTDAPLLTHGMLHGRPLPPPLPPNDLNGSNSNARAELAKFRKINRPPKLEGNTLPARATIRKRIGEIHHSFRAMQHVADNALEAAQELQRLRCATFKALRDRIEIAAASKEKEKEHAAITPSFELQHVPPRQPSTALPPPP